MEEKVNTIINQLFRGMKSKKIIKALVIMFALLSCLSVEVYAKTYTYDALNRVTQGINDNGVIQTYTYDKAGNR